MYNSNGGNSAASPDAMPRMASSPSSWNNSPMSNSGDTRTPAGPMMDGNQQPEAYFRYPPANDQNSAMRWKAPSTKNGETSSEEAETNWETGPGIYWGGDNTEEMRPGQNAASGSRPNQDTGLGLIFNQDSNQGSSFSQDPSQGQRLNAEINQGEGFSQNSGQVPRFSQNPSEGSMSEMTNDPYSPTANRGMSYMTRPTTDIRSGFSSGGWEPSSDDGNRRDVMPNQGMQGRGMTAPLNPQLDKGSDVDYLLSDLLTSLNNATLIILMPDINDIT